MKCAERMVGCGGGVGLKVFPTVSFTDLDQSSEIIIFGSIWTTFEANTTFWGSWGSSKNWIELKVKPA